MGTKLVALWLVAVFAAGPAGACTLAFTDVAVVPMDRAAVLLHQTVRIDGERIVGIGPADSTSADDCAAVVQGRGRYLMPGLIDSHVHVESAAFTTAFGAETGPIDFEDVLALYPAHGVTGIRVLSGAPDILAFRDGVARSAPVPRLAVASPMLAGAPPILPPPVTRVVETPAQARAAVREVARAGYDLIKIRENLRDDVFRAVTDEAKRLALDVDGHVTRSKTLVLPDLIKGGQRGFAHLDEIARAMSADNGRKREEIVRLLKTHNAHVSSTMTVLKSAADQIANYERMAARPEMRFLHPLFTRTFWARARNPYLKPGVERGFFVELLGETKRALEMLNDRGVRILAGTDALNPMIVPGLSLHEELQLMVEAGLSPYEALRTATVNPARVLARFGNAGVVAVGRDADLILLAANPLDSSTPISRPVGVVLRGRWYERAELDRRLEEVAAKFRRQ